MATRRKSDRATVIEQHPIYHAWHLSGDFVVARRGSRIIAVRREEKCDFCPTERHTAINTTTWTPIRRPRYKYVRNTVIVRMSKPDYRRDRFLATTDLPADEKAQLR